MSGRIQLVLPPNQVSQSAAIEAAASIAVILEARLTLSIPQTNAQLTTHWLAREYVLADVSAFNLRAGAGAQQLKQEALDAARAAGVEAHPVELVHGVVGGERSVVLAARTHDFSILGLADQDVDRRRLAEQLLFDSGRPLLVVPLSRPVKLACDTIALAWDHSEPASRVLSAAMPIIKMARRVHVFSVIGAKKLPRADAAADAAAYIQSHGVAADWELMESEDRSRGRFIMETAIARGAGLLIMGAYATLPAQEYVMGGVTVSVLHEPLLPVLMAN